MEQKYIYNEAYVEALRTNENETQRWTAYRQEHLELKTNLRMYQKFPRADILIPMGTKALLPGELYHTGEVLVSHGNGYFSECSSEQAQTIVDRRVRLADEMLHKYERERSLYGDRLEAPFINEAFAKAEGDREIIEAYDEQTEERWRERHRQSVRESKQKEAQQRAGGAASKEDQDDKQLLEKLEVLELQEELENELDQLETPDGLEGEDDDQLSRLLRGEIQLNEKKRTAHRSGPVDDPGCDVHETVSDAGKKMPVDETKMLPEQNTTVIEDVNTTTPGEDIEPTDDEDASDDWEDDEEDISPEFSELLIKTKNCTKEEKLVIFQTTLKDTRIRLSQNSISIIEKVNLYQLYEELEEAIDFLRPVGTNSEEDIEQKEPVSEEMPKTATENNQNKQARRIKFAKHDQIKLIDAGYSSAFTKKEKLASQEKTLCLHIVHTSTSRQGATKEGIVSPADIYRLFQEEVRIATQPPAIEVKSILKNKQLIDKEIHRTDGTLGTNSSKRTVKQTREKPSMPDDVLGDVIEHTTDSEGSRSGIAQPPQQKKKVSRFKQQRH